MSLPSRQPHAAARPSSSRRGRTASPPARLAIAGGLLASSLALSLVGTAHAAAPAVRDTTAVRAPMAAYAPFVADAEASTRDRVRVLVGLRTRFVPGDAVSARSSQKERIAASRKPVLAALAGHPHTVTRTFETLPFIGLEASPEALEALERSGEVASIHPDEVLQDQLADSTATIESAGQVARGFNGAGKVVAILDNGFDLTNPFLAGRAVDPACFAGNGSCPNGQNQQVGPGSADPRLTATPAWHGTAVAGVAVGKRSAGGTFDGVAPAAKFMPVRVSSTTGYLESDVLAGLDYVMGRVAAGVPVASVNVSQGTKRPIVADSSNCDDGPTKTAIDGLKAAGVATVVAAGNNAWTNAVLYPACVSTAVTVGAVDKADVPADFSNSSEQVDLLAPGKEIVTSVIGGFQPVDGTSFAAPHVAGAWASYLQRYPGTSVDDVLAAFQRSGRSVTDARNGVVKRRINLARALARWGYVDATQESAASYVPAAQGNSTSVANSVTRTGTGLYTVTFPRLGTGLAGNAQVRAFAGNANSCKIAGLAAAGTSGTSVELDVRCATATGTPADTQFHAEYRVDESKDTRRRGYLTTLTSGGSLSLQMNANSTGAVNTLERLGTGRYLATFPGFSGGTAVPHVTAVGNDDKRCQITGFIDDTVGVKCFGVTGASADSGISLTYEEQGTFIGAGGAQLFANQLTATTPYTPGLSWNSTGATNTAGKTALGRYRIDTPNILGIPSSTMITAVGNSTPVQCGLEVAASSTLFVKCFGPDGTAKDSAFTVTYARKG